MQPSQRSFQNDKQMGVMGNSQDEFIFKVDPGKPMLSKFFEVTYLAIPGMICTIMRFVQELVNLYYVAGLRENELLVAIGLANVVQNCLGSSTNGGITQTMETFVAQTFG